MAIKILTGIALVYGVSIVLAWLCIGYAALSSKHPEKEEYTCVITMKKCYELQLSNKNPCDTCLTTKEYQKEKEKCRTE